MTDLHVAFWTHYRVRLPMDDLAANQLIARFQTGELASALGDVQFLGLSQSLAPTEKIEPHNFLPIVTVKQPYHTDYYGFERRNLATPKQSEIALLANGSIVERWPSPEHFLDWLRDS